MLASVSTDAPYYDVYMWNVPTTTEDVPMTRVPGWDIWYPHLFAKGLNYDNPTGWENRRIYFWGDADGDEYMDSDEPFAIRVIPAGALAQNGLPFVTDVNVTPGAHPTISWRGVTDASIDQYRIRFFLVNSGTGLADTKYPVFQSEAIGIENDNLYEFAYDGDLFQTYGELAICIEARDFLLEDPETGEGYNYGLVNRSRYFVNHVVPIPGTALLMGSGLIGIIVVRRKKKVV